MSAALALPVDRGASLTHGSRPFVSYRPRSINLRTSFPSRSYPEFS